MIELKFNIKDLGLEDLSNRKRSQANYRRLKRNANRYVNWLLKILEDNVEKKYNEQYSINGVFMSVDNIAYLHSHLDPYTFLDLSPVERAMENNIVLIDEEKVVEINKDSSFYYQ